MNPRIAGGLAAVFLAAALPAAAATGAASASATIGNFSYRLIDLTPNDGQTPSLTLGPWSPAPFATIFSDTAYRDQRIDNFRHDDGDVSARYGNDTASAGITLQDGHAAVDIADRSGRAEASSFSYFTLSPNTRLAFLAYATGSTAVDGGAQADAKAGIYGARFAGSTTPESDIYDTLFVTQPGSRQRWVEVDVISDAEAVSGYLTVFAEVEATGFTPAAPVPEPAHAAMLLAGLLLLLSRFRPGFRAPA